MLAHLGDTATTHYALTRTDASEANPVARLAINLAGMPGLYALKAAYIGWVYYQMEQEAAGSIRREEILAVSTIFGVMPTVNNAAVIAAK